MKYREQLDSLVMEHGEVTERFFRECRDAIGRSVEILVECLSGGGKVLAFGNGGSAADASHLAAELVNRFRKDRPPLAAVALTTDPSVLTSIANDYGYEEVFARQVRAHGRRGDVALGITTSGGSANVLRALDAARSIGMKTIALTGNRGTTLAACADLVLAVPSSVTPRIQEVHALYLHVLCEIVEEAMFPRG